MKAEHGDDIYKYDSIKINLSSNTWQKADHAGLYAYLAENLSCISNYPEPNADSLEKEIARTENVNTDEIIATNGATEAIYLTAQAFKNSKSAILSPTFSEYEKACRLNGHTTTKIKNLYDEMSSNTMMWICNPNNPTGKLIEKEPLLDFIDTHTNTTFVIDSSYSEFTTKPCITPEDTIKRNNIILLKSLTKQFSIPGIRIGYATANKNLTEKIRHQKMPWSVNQLAIETGKYLLQHKNHYAIDAEALNREALRVGAEMEKTNKIEVVKTDTHILLCKLISGNAFELKEFLARKYGILIRDASNFDGLDEKYFRIAVQRENENNEFLKRLNEWLQV